MKWLSHIGKQASRMASLELFRYIGPGFFVTVGFIDPGNWVTNVAAGSQFGYQLLWVVSLSTVILIVVQHNAAHLGIVTGLCLSEAASKFFKPWLRFFMLGSAMIACIATALAELLGAAIGLNMLTGLPLVVGAVLSALFSAWMLFSKNYQRLEKWIMGFVSLIGMAFIFEIGLADVAWGQTLVGWVKPAFPAGALPVIMGVLGAVVMPHNIFLHSEVIQSRQWNAQGDDVIKKHLKYEFMDTLTGMGVGWAINSAMIIMAAAVFYKNGVVVNELPQVTMTLEPIFGNGSAVVFALGLLVAGLSSSVTAAMAGKHLRRHLYRALRYQRSPFPHRPGDHAGGCPGRDHAAARSFQRHPLEPGRPLPATPADNHPADPFDLVEKGDGRVCQHPLRIGSALDCRLACNRTECRLIG